MKVIFHPTFCEVYTSDPVAAPGRMEPVVKALEKEFQFVKPGPASERDLERVHGKSRIQFVKEEPQVYEIGILAAGGAIARLKYLEEKRLIRRDTKRHRIVFSLKTSCPVESPL